MPQERVLLISLPGLARIPRRAGITGAFVDVVKFEVKKGQSMLFCSTPKCLLPAASVRFWAFAAHAVHCCFDLDMSCKLLGADMGAKSKT